MNIIKTLDIRTLLHIYVMVQLVVTITFVTAMTVYKKNYIKTLTVGFVISSIGVYLIASQSVTMPFAKIIIANFGIVLGIYIITKGLLEIMGIVFKNILIIILMLLHLTTFLYFTYYNPNTNARIVIFTLEEIIPSVFIMYFYFKNFLKTKDINRIGIVIINLLYILSIIPRTASSLFGENLVTLFDDIFPLRLMLSYTILFLVLRGYIIILIVAKELQDELIEVNSKLEYLSYIDHMTKLYNNRAIMEKLGDEITRTNRYHNVTTVAILDLDNFKQVNDNHGHVFGDDVLRTFASLAKKDLRKMDKIGRYGGEEFLIVMPETNKNEAFMIVERLKDKFKQTKWEVECDMITFSSGIIEINDNNASLDVRTLIDRADQALYKAKENGKDRIEIYD